MRRQNSPRLWLAFACAASPCLAATGPIVADRVADRMIDSFETAKPLYFQRARGKAKPVLIRRSGIARHGSTSLLVEMPAAGDKGRNSLLMTWRFDPAQDFSAYEGLSILLQTHGDPPPRLTPRVVEASNAHYWWRGPMAAPRREGEWQVVELPFKKWTWCWEAGKDPNNQLDLTAIKALMFELRAAPDRPWTLGIDGVGLYTPRPKYAGPILRLRPIGRQAKSFVREPGQEFEAKVELRQLPAGRKAEVRLVGTDYWGDQTLAKTVTFEGEGDGSKAVEKLLRFKATEPGYTKLVGVVRVEDKDVYRCETGLACVKPMNPADAKPNPESMFGIWVGGGHEAIGAKWDRKLIRISSITKVGDTYQFAGGKPGVPRGKWGWGSPDLGRIACFVTMAKWLSSKPDRADYYKWSPTSWDEYARVIKWVVSGTSKAGIRHYEVWNEPVPYAGWMGPMESVVKLHEVTYKAIKAVQPDAVVLGPCPYTFKWDFLEKFFQLGGGKWIDDVVTHTYDSAPPDVNFPSNLKKLRALMARYGLGDRGIYITEMGYPTPRVTEREQAQYLVRAFVYARAAGVKVFLWHMLWDYHGVHDPQHYIGEPGHAIKRFDHSPRPAWVAYAAMTRMLENAEYVGPVAGLAATQRGVEFRKRGKRIRVLWDMGDELTRLTLRSPATQLAVVDVVGRERVLRAGADAAFMLQLSGDPVYVVE